MGEALMTSCGGGKIADMPELLMRSEDKTNDGGGESPTTATTNNVVRWEKFLPKMTLRVLLVEADDCTRQIITALLRKCSYKVVAVSDGLKAWEVLKGRSQSIDLILTEVLLSNMAYAEDDESLLDAEEDGSLPDRDQDLKPRCHSSRFHGSDDAKDDDDDIVNIWNLRKCSAAALDIISNVFGDEILPTLMPSVQAKLSKLDDASWKERGAAVLALGAIAEGCINGLYPHLSEIVAFLIPLLDDKFPLIRSISCWTLSRFSKFIVQGIGHPEGLEQFEKVLTGLLRRILDNNKRVQEAACSAFATLEECLHEAGNNQKTTLLDLYHEALDPKLYKKKDSDCFELKSQPQRSSWNHNMNGGYSVKKHKGGFIDHTIRQIRDLPPAALFQLLDKWSKLTDGVTEIHEKVKELQLQEKLENNNLKETATRSRKQTIQKSSKTLNEKAATLMGSITREYMMQPIECIPFHEIVCFTYVNKLQAGLLGDPRKRIQLDLLGSHTFIKCSCCTKSGSFPMSTMHDTTLMYDVSRIPHVSMQL